MSRDAIVDLLNLYAVALDGHAWDLFDSVFTADVDADYPGGAKMRWHDLASFKRDFAAYHVPLATHQHSMTNHQVLLQGDRAYSLTYGSFRLVEPDASGTAGGVREGVCWYDDQHLRTSAGWRIHKRLARVFWAGGAAPASGSIGDAGFSQGRRPGGAVDSLPDMVRHGRIAFFNALRASPRAIAG